MACWRTVSAEIKKLAVMNKPAPATIKASRTKPIRLKAVVAVKGAFPVFKGRAPADYTIEPDAANRGGLL
jgi:hypothetical protein